MCNEEGSENGNNVKQAGLILWESPEGPCTHLSAILLFDILGKAPPALTSQFSGKIPRVGTLACALL